jgi:hypothetical protein
MRGTSWENGGIKVLSNPNWGDISSSNSFTTGDSLELFGILTCLRRRERWGNRSVGFYYSYSASLNRA